MNKKKALIIGITGQDGAYLARYLVDIGYDVYGSSRDAQMSDRSRLATLGVSEMVKVVSIAPNDFRSVLSALVEIYPDEVYNLSGQSSVGLSFSQPIECNESVSNSVLTLMEAIRFSGINCKFFNAGSSECFGDTGKKSANEQTSFKPRSPYAVAKSSAFWNVVCFRDSYNLFCCTGILGNHDSPLRPERFVTMKIVKAALNIANGYADSIRLGRTDIVRDWGWAPDYVKAMHLMLQPETPKDYIIATGRSASLDQFVSSVFSHLNLDHTKYLVCDNTLSRPNELSESRLDPSKIQAELGWECMATLDFITKSMLEHHARLSR